jgi:hypothetical protein
MAIAEGFGSEGKRFFEKKERETEEVHMFFTRKEREN